MKQVLLFILAFCLCIACSYLLVIKAIERKNPFTEINSQFAKNEILIEELRDTSNGRYLKYKTEHKQDSIRFMALYHEVAIEISYRKKYETMRDSLSKVLSNSKAPKYLPK